MINFYNEIEEVLKEHKKTIDDIIWIGTRKHKVDKNKFLKDAKKLKYDNGYGIQNINERLIIAGDDWYLERWEYDGSEGFAYISKLKEPLNEIEYSRKFIIPETYLRDYYWLD